MVQMDVFFFFCVVLASLSLEKILSSVKVQSLKDILEIQIMGNMEA